MGGIPGNVLPALRKGEGGKGNAGLAAVSLASRAALAAMFSLRGKGLGRPGGSPAILLCSIIACLEGEKESTCNTSVLLSAQVSPGISPGRQNTQITVFFGNYFCLNQLDLTDLCVCSSGSEPSS